MSAQRGLPARSALALGVLPPGLMVQGARTFMELRAWQACTTFKIAVYRLCRTTSIAGDRRLCEQLQDAAAGPPAHLAEGFGRFTPGDFARYAGFARASLMESQNHLRDAVDRQHISEATCADLNALAVIALQEVTGLMGYLQSPGALRNARRVRERRIATRQANARLDPTGD